MRFVDLEKIVKKGEQKRKLENFFLSKNQFLEKVTRDEAKTIQSTQLQQGKRRVRIFCYRFFFFCLFFFDFKTLLLYYELESLALVIELVQKVRFSVWPNYNVSSTYLR